MRETCTARAATQLVRMPRLVLDLSRKWARCKRAKGKPPRRGPMTILPMVWT